MILFKICVEWIKLEDLAGFILLVVLVLIVAFAALVIPGEIG